MKKPLGRLAAAVLTGAALTLASAPAAFAQDDTSSTTPTSESTSDTATSPATSASTSDTPTSSDSSTSSPDTASDTLPSAPPPGSDAPADPQVRTTEDIAAPRQNARSGQEDGESGDSSDSAEPGDPYTDNVGHGFVGVGGEGILVIACIDGPPGNVSTLGLSVTAGPDQDGADGRLWNYDVRVNPDYTGTSAPFSWTCDGQEGHGEVTFQTGQPPTSDTPPSTETATSSETPTSGETPAGTPTSSSSSTTSATAPGGTTTGSTAATSPLASSSTRPAAQVRYSPEGGVETGFGGTALFWF